MSHVKNRNFKEALYFYEEAQKIEYNEPTQIAIRGLKKELKSNNTSTNSNSSNSGYKSNTSSSNNTSSAYSTSNSYNTTTSAQDEVIADGVMALAQGLGSLLSGNNNTYRVSESDKKERREKLRINLASWNNNEDFNALEKVLFTGYPRYTRYNDEYLPNKKYDAKFHEDLLWMYLTHSSTRKFSKYTAIGLDDLGDLHINKEAITYFKLAYRQGSCLGKKLVSKRRIKYIKNSIIRILGKSEANSWFKNIKKNDNCNKVQLDFEKFKIDNLPEEYKLSTSELYEKGMVFYKNKEFKEAYKLIKIAAEREHMDSEYTLGRMFEFGYGVKENGQTSIYWYKRAAKNGHKESLLELGDMYRDAYSDGASKDYNKAIWWYNKAIEKGNSDAQWRMGLMYERGYGFKQDYKTAIIYYKKSAALENNHGKVLLGHMYRDGKGVPKNNKTAINWYSNAAKQDYPYGQSCLGNMYQKGQGVTKNYKTAIYWYEKAENKSALGDLYRELKDFKTAIYWYEKAAAESYIDQYYLGIHYLEGTLGSKNKELAKKWLKKSCVNWDYACDALKKIN